MKPERKQAFEIFQKFESVGMTWEKARSCSLIYVNGVMDIEKKNCNLLQVEMLMKVKREIETI
jgi:hypothetical protein